MYRLHPSADVKSDPKAAALSVQPWSLGFPLSSLSSVGLASQLYPNHNAISPAVMGNIALHNLLITHLQN